MKVMRKSRVTFDEMPALVESLVVEVRRLRRVVDSFIMPLQPERKATRKVLSTDDVCKLLGMTRISIYRMIKRGDLVAYKKGKNLFFFEDEILSELESGRIRSKSELPISANECIETV